MPARLQRVGGLYGAVVELDALADADRAGSRSRASASRVGLRHGASFSCS